MSTPERLTYWYLRLNGFLTIENFIVHPDTGRNQRTDADLLAVRFQYRQENLERTMQDAPKVVKCDRYCNVLICEVKTNVCALNGTWTRPDDKNIHRVLAAVGCITPDNIEVAAHALYNDAVYTSENVQVKMIAFGNRQGELAIPAQQILFDEMIDFIWDRLRKYRAQKRSVGNWAEDGRAIISYFDEHRSNKPLFNASLRQYFGLIRESGGGER